MAQLLSLLDWFVFSVVVVFFCLLRPLVSVRSFVPPFGESFVYLFVCLISCLFDSFFFVCLVS